MVLGSEENVTQIPKPTNPRRVFGQIAWRFALQGLLRGIAYGMVYGMIYGAIVGFGFGVLYGLVYGALIGAIVGTAMGVIGGCVLGGFSVYWGRRQGGVMSEPHTANRDGYRRGVLLLAVGTTVLGSALLFPSVVGMVFQNGITDPVSTFLFLDLVPSLIAGFAAFLAGRGIIAWYETNVGLPRDIMIVGSNNQDGVWPPPPRRPEA